MTRLHTTSLHRQAKALLSRQGSAPKKLVLFHTLIALGIPLLVMLINLLLDQQIAKTGGLGGMAARSRLETVQSILETSVVILLPFWQVGLLFAALSWRKGQTAEKSHLTEGFRRFINIFALRLWTGIVYTVLGIAAIYVSSFVFTLTPWAQPVADLIATTDQPITPELMYQMRSHMTPLFIILGVVYAAMCIPMFYRLRFADFILLEGEGGLRSMMQSFRLTRGSCRQIFKLDLHFWWFYLLQVLVLILCFGDMLLPLLGVTLPISPALCGLLFYAAALLLEGFLLWRYEDARLTTYALAYDALQPQAAPEM